MKQITVVLLATFILLLTAPFAFAESSAEARQRKTVFFQGHVGLLAEPSLAASTGLFLSQNFLVEAHGSVSTSLTGEAQNALGTVRGRYFLGNSIFVLLGAGHRGYRRVTTQIDPAGVEVKKSEEYISDLGFEVAMGNLWTHGSFMIGLDWAYLYVPMATLDRLKRSYDKYGELEESSRSKSGYYAPPIFISPRLNIGFAF